MAPCCPRFAQARSRTDTTGLQSAASEIPGKKRPFASPFNVIRCTDFSQECPT